VESRRERPLATPVRARKEATKSSKRGNVRLKRRNSAAPAGGASSFSLAPISSARLQSRVIGNKEGYVANGYGQLEPSADRLTHDFVTFSGTVDRVSAHGDLAAV
jgi:hypothetical protein